jgi:2-polyprenyl-6-hydroxyphenyl methylase/3-demethylubiquinone-9 3-methyltransferase
MPFPSSASALDHPLRRLDLMDHYRVLRDEDMLLFNVMMRKPGALLHRPCPACTEDKPKHDFQKDGFDFAKCQSCGCVYILPVPSPELLEWYYDKSLAIKYFYDYILLPSLPQRRNIFADRVAKISPYVKPGGSILEIGSSVGMFVEAAKDAGFKMEGVEPNSELAASTAQTYDVPVSNCFFEDYQSQRRFDAVVIWEVIEHIIEPKPILQKIHGILNSDGVVAMTLPNFAGIEYGICGERNEMVEGPGHINYFTPQTITHLLQSSGFEMVTLSTPGILDFSNVINHIRREDPEAEIQAAYWPDASKPPKDIGAAFLLWLLKQMTPEERKTIDNLATVAIQRSQMSGNMFVVARRK